MPAHAPTVSPSAVQNARAVIDATFATTCHPAIIGGAWATLKAARGQVFHGERLNPAHLINAAAAPATPGHITDMAVIRDRAAARARRHAAIMGYTRAAASDTPDSAA